MSKEEIDFEELKLLIKADFEAFAKATNTHKKLLKYLENNHPALHDILKKP